MKLSEAIVKTQARKGITYYADEPKDDDPNVLSSRGGKSYRWEKLLKKGDPLSITYAVNRIPRIEVQSMINRLSKPRYKNLKGTEIAISKLKWRRGY
jgi:hypothetical protein